MQLILTDSLKSCIVVGSQPLHGSNSNNVWLTESYLCHVVSPIRHFSVQPRLVSLI